MSKKRHSPEQIITRLCEAELLQANGQTLAQVRQALSVTQQAYYRWRKEYGGLTIDQANRLKALEKENSPLKEVVAD